MQKLFLFLITGLLGFIPWAAAETGQSLITDNYGLIRATGEYEDQCLRVINEPYRRGSEIELWDCKKEDSQLWQYNPKTHIIKNVGGYCLSVQDVRGKEGTPVVIWDCEEGKNQMWTHQEKGRIKGYQDKCLHVEALGEKGRGSKLTLRECIYQISIPNQIFWGKPVETTLVDPRREKPSEETQDRKHYKDIGRDYHQKDKAPIVYQPITAGNGLCLDVHRGDYDEKKAGGRVQLWECNGEPNQDWRFKNGKLRSRNALCLEAMRRVDGAKVETWPCTDTPSQVWIRSGKRWANSEGRCLDVHIDDFEAKENGGMVQMWDCHQNDNQKWTFVEP